MIHTGITYGQAVDIIVLAGLLVVAIHLACIIAKYYSNWRKAQ